MRALLSVYDKTGVVEFGKVLASVGFELVSTGGTFASLAAAGLHVSQVSDITGSPEILDGRVKTLHPAVHAGILARRGLSDHMRQLDELGIGTIDVVVCNLYPFVDTVSRPNGSLEDALENIDIGGPTLIRAAAKSFPDVVVVVDPADYVWVGERLPAEAAGPSSTWLSLDERRRLAAKAFQHVAVYDSAVSQYLSPGAWSEQDELALGFTKLQDVHYGENPHQKGALYADVLSSGGVVRAEKLHGPEMSFNNALDADAAWRVVCDFEAPAATVVKHNNPCGLAVHDDQPTAYQRALEGDSVSAYGGVVAFNRTVTAATAEAMRGVLYHIVVAPGYDPDALEVLSKRRSLRVLKSTRAQGPLVDVDLRRVSGGLLVQTADAMDEDPATWKVVTTREPTAAELEDLAFAWKAAKHIKSNTIVLARDRMMVGMGAGQPNRVTSVHLALRIAGDKSRGSVLASDAFMPFADNVEMAGTGGVTAIVQPGGSIRDEEVVAAADERDMAMVFTGIRHFRH